MISTQKVRDLRIVLLGKSGSGKSATGNTILGREAFEVVDFIKSANKLCEKQEGKVGGKTVSIIDTPGLFNTAVTKQQLKNEIQKCIVMSAPGPHVFLLVLKLGVRFTQEERDAVKCIQENFGKEALCRTIILFTHADQLKGKPVDEYINKSNNLKEIVASCGGRYHSFNNEERESKEQVVELMNKIDAVMEENEMNHYTFEMFKTAQKKKEINLTKAACGIAVLGIGFLGTVKIAGMIAATAISGGAAVEKTAESVLPATGEAVDKVMAAVDKLLAAIEKGIQTASEAVTKEAVEAVEKAVESAGEAAAKKAEETLKKAVEIAGEAAAAKAVLAIEAAGGEAVQTSGAGVAGVAGTALVSGLCAGAARAAAAAGKVATSGRVSVVAAVAAAVGGAVVTLISAFKK